MTAARVLSGLALAAASLAVPAGPARGDDDPCAGDPVNRAPDPRCGEPLDGRTVPDPPASVQAARVALAVPRAATRVVLWPVVKTTDVVEEYQLAAWLRALLTTDDGLVGIRPVLNYSTSFLPTGGVRGFYDRLPGHQRGSDAQAQFQTAGPSVMIAEARARGPDWLGLSMFASWNRRDDRLFAGIGPNTDDELTAAGHGPARYGSDNWMVALRWDRALGGWVSVDLTGDVVRRDYRSGDVNGGPSVATLFGLPPDACAAQGLSAGCVDPAQLPGFATGVRLAHAGGGVAFTARDRAARDGSGAGIRFDGAIAQGFAGDPSRHATLAGESVLALGGHDRQLLLRGKASVVERLGDAPVPFDELVSPAGALGLRGFADGRFRGPSGIVTSAEYRWYISAYLDAALFTDVGTVAGPRFEGLGASQWFPDFGLGFRFYKPQGPYWETQALSGLQLAYAPQGGLRVLLSMASF